MARSVRDAKLESRTARLKLAVQKRHWKGVTKGLHLGYRRAKTGAGTWSMRYVDPKTGRYRLQPIGKADDFVDANGLTVLTYFQAQERVRERARELDTQDVDASCGAYTVRDALGDYLHWFQENRKALKATEHAAGTHIIPKLGDVELSKLTAEQLRKWHQGLAKTHPRARSSKLRARTNLRKTYDQRARRATANRVLTVLKAALNHAWRDGKVASNQAWAKVAPFRNVDAPRIRYLSVEECSRLINAADADLRPLIRAALYTGCRYGEIARMVCGDFDPDSGTVLVRESKSGKPRHAYLTQEARKFFARQVLGRHRSATMFVHADGVGWRAAHQRRPLLQACNAAGIEPPISFHVLRHTYGSLLAMKGVPLQVIAEALGHADTRITHRHYAHLLPSYVAKTIRANLPDYGLERGNVRPIGSRKRSR